VCVAGGGGWGVYCSYTDIPYLRDSTELEFLKSL
jgi:hypothetical protein